MPRYDYRCSVCGHVYEKREGFDAPPLQTCPDCAGVARRVLTSPAIVFKGSGWYINDSRKGTGDDSSSSSPSSTVPSSDGGSTETKDEAGRGEGAAKGDGAGNTPTPTTASAGTTEKAAKAEKAD